MSDLNNKKFIPKEYQKEIINFALERPKCGVFAGMGMGKTSATLCVINALKQASMLPQPALVVAPLRVAGITWPDEVAKWAHLKGLTVSKILGTPAQRERALNKKADIYLINYENATWLNAILKKRKQGVPFSMLVLDESTKIKSFRLRRGGKRARDLAQIAIHKSVERVMLLTGTPSPNGLKDLWGQIWFLDQGERLGTTYTKFTEQFFRTGFDGYSMEPLPHAADAIHDKLRDICISVQPEDYFDLNEPIKQDIKFELPEKARKIYDALQKDYLADIEGADGEEDFVIEAFNAASKSIKCLQAANGALYREDGTYHNLHDEKLDILRSIYEEASGSPLLVAYHFKFDLDRIRKKFPEAKVLDKNPETIRAWNRGEIPMLLAHPASAGHGLNLQDGGNILVYYSHTFNMEERMQIQERIGSVRQKQAGHDRPLFVYNIIADKTLDVVAIDRCTHKKSIQDALNDALKRGEI